MTVYVVMGNDFPEAVFTTQEAATSFCERMREEDKRQNRGGRIYWRAWAFKLDPAEQEAA